MPSLSAREQMGGRQGVRRTVLAELARLAQRRQPGVKKVGKATFDGTRNGRNDGREPWAPRRINLPAHLEQLRERSLPLSLAYDHLVPSLAVVRGVGGEHARKLGLRL